jgi:hypothetical protein
MKRLTIVALGALALNGCTGTHIKPPAVCDGKHRRPANLYGSILPSLPVPLPASQQGSGESLVAPPSGAASPASAPTRAPMHVPTPGADTAPTTPSGPGAMNVPDSASRTALRDAAPSYFSC